MGMARRPLGNGTLQFKAMVSPDPLMGPARLSAPARQRRDRQRPRPADRPPAPARLLHGAVGLGLAEHRRRTAASSSTPACPASRPSGRPRSCTARRSSIPRSADHPPLARFHPHQLRRPDRRHCARPREARGQPLQRPRARPAPLEHRDRAAGFDRGPAVVEPHAHPGAASAAGAISPIPNSSSPASTRNAGRRARCGRTRSRPAGSSPARSPGAGSPRSATATMRWPPKPRSSTPNGRCSRAPR